MIRILANAAALATTLLSALSFATTRLDAYPSQVNFPPQPLNGGIGFSTVQIFNRGQETAKGLYVRWACDPSFLISNRCYLDLAPGQSCSIGIQYQATQPGTHFCRIDVSSTNAFATSISVQGSAF